MTQSTHQLERELIDDLSKIAERFADDESSRELYRALTNRVWRKDGGPDGHVALSWRRAEEVVNALREQHGREPLELDQTGGEGEVARKADEELGRLGWHSAPLDTGRHDPQHVESAEDPPAPKQAGSPAIEQGHREADERRP